MIYREKVNVMLDDDDEQVEIVFDNEVIDDEDDEVRVVVYVQQVQLHTEVDDEVAQVIIEQVDANEYL